MIKKPRFLNLYRDRHGKVRLYYRRPGCLRVPMPLPMYTEAFWIAYHRADAAAQAQIEAKADVPAVPPAVTLVGQAGPGSMSALIEAYYRSAEWRSLASRSRATYRHQLEHFRQEFGAALVARFTTKHVNLIMDRLADRPAAANNLRDRLNVLMKFAVANGWCTDNPVARSKNIRHTSRGYRTWSEADIEAFRKRWPIGTRQRLAMEILLYTGLRRSDAVRLGRQHVQKVLGVDAFVLTTVKGRAELTIPIHPNLKPILATVPADQLTYIVTAYGAPRSPQAFTNWLKEAASKAGLPPDSSPHGLRKAACRRLAEAGATPHGIMAITGHRNLREVEVYTAAVRRDQLALRAIEQMVEAFPDRENWALVTNRSYEVVKSADQVSGHASLFGGGGGAEGSRTPDL
jgi:site-specific recombinase XerD